MKLFKNNKGFNVLEVLIVAGFMAILVIMAGGLSGKFALRRNIDNVANRITSELNITKLQAARDGVQYRTLINFDGDDRRLTIKSVRGDSNRASTFDNDSPITEQSMKIMSDYAIIPSEVDTTIDFNPNGTIASATTITMRPTDIEESDVKKCARIIVSRFGRINTIIGRWDFNTDECNPITDKQEIPSS